MWRERMPRATDTAEYEGPGRSPTPEEIADVIKGAEELNRQAAESEQSPTYSAAAEAEQYTAEAAAEYGDVEPGQESAEDAAEVQANETLRTDAEILGNRYPVSQMIKGAGNTLQWGKERAAAAWNNAMEQPGLLMDKFMHGLAQSSYDRRKAKLDEVAHLSDNHPLKKFRMRKLQKAEARLNKRKANLEIRQNRMTGRVEAVKKHAAKLLLLNYQNVEMRLLLAEKLVENYANKVQAGLRLVKLPKNTSTLYQKINAAASLAPF